MRAVPAELVDAGLPLRMSVRDGDRHYDPNGVGLSDKVDVILDGLVLAHATSWDVVAGEVTRHKRGADNRFCLDERGAPTFETLKGKVEVRWIRADGSRPA